MVLQSLLTRFDEIHGIGGLVADIGHASAEFTGLHGSSRALFVATVSSIHNQGIVLVTRNNREASDFYTDLSHFLEADSLHLFPSRETLPYDDARPFRESMMKRMVTLHSIVRGEGGIVIVPVRSLLEFVIPRELYEGSIIRIARNDSVPPPTLLQRLVELGYERVDRVSVPGQFSARGDLVDAHPEVDVPGRRRDDHPVVRLRRRRGGPGKAADGGSLA
jgi:transcription-repair coupling factor (superfamily II helicase)